MHPPPDGWSFAQVKELALPFDWEFLDGMVRVRGTTGWWHDQVRDELACRLRRARTAAFGSNIERCTMLDARNVPKPDIVVFDKRGLDLRTLHCTPGRNAVLAVEVVSPLSHSEDRHAKHALYAAAGIASYWRVERDENDLPVVHEFRLHHESGVYAPSPERPLHTGKLVTSVPFPVDIDLRELTEA
ncbi:hypothetical protein GKJPGBOP_03650 [Streptomyces paromomycinus]|uniref:Putative restriction endonuclease domain-containing protein n=2 Tax=Streptomyces paromomycinus TaxID=92743 RepID=A0A401W3S4_STREY|nr:hypothetical protein GKJPGBOP_03650 [Streptomyces paromomycinus]